MFNITFYSFAKRDNSTKVPTGSGTNYSCVLKAGSGILNPTISLDIGLVNNPSNFNYAYIQEFGRYYFVDEWVFDNRLWTAHLTVDVLATYKTEIGNSTLYVLRSADSYDGTIIDTLYPSKTGCSFQTDALTSPWSQVAIYVIGVVSAEAEVGSLKYYVLTSQQLSSLCDYLLDDIITQQAGYTIDGVSDSVVLNLLDPLQYIKSCVMLPLSFNDLKNLSVGGTVKVLNYPAGTFAFAGVNSESYAEKTLTFDIIKHPDTGARGNYVNSSPYTKITLTIPPIGTIDIDTSITCNASNITAIINVDCITGAGVCTISCNGVILNRIETQIGVPISLSSITREKGSTIFNALTNPSVLAGGSIGLWEGTAIGNASDAKNANVSTIGSTGSFVSLRGACKLDHQFFRPVNDDIIHNGRPLCQMRKINTLSGYMKIQDGDVTIAGTSAEDSKIRNYLEGGFYYE